MHIIMKSEFANVVVVRSLQHLENSINTFEEELDDGDPLNKLTESSCINTEKAEQTLADKEHAVVKKNPFLSISIRAKIEIQICMTSGRLRSLNRK